MRQPSAAVDSRDRLCHWPCSHGQFLSAGLLGRDDRAQHGTRGFGENVAMGVGQFAVAQTGHHSLPAAEGPQQRRIRAVKRVAGAIAAALVCQWPAKWH